MYEIEHFESEDKGMVARSCVCENRSPLSSGFIEK